jgi:two-component system CheB/CheR fusion protein
MKKKHEKAAPPESSSPSSRQIAAPPEIGARLLAGSELHAAEPGAPSDAGSIEEDPEARGAGAKQGRLFPIVGIGASAGGLEAFTELLERLPGDTGMAFVLVQHLDPTHQSILADLLSRTTALPVREAQNDMPLEPNHVYVIPPNTTMTVAGEVLKLVEAKREGGAHHSIDLFLESLARDRGLQAIGVILSGTASDGTLGLEAIKNEGGITFAQDGSAKYDSMPRSAIASGCVDFVLPPQKIAEELGRIARHPRLLPTESQPSGEPSKETGDYRKILQLLRLRTGVDFSLYKPATIERRIARRMVVNKTPRLSAYLKHLRAHPEEVDALYQDVLIRVTGFFRNPETFELLKQEVFPKIIINHTPNQPVRVWVLGCSTGQEAYSIAMSFLEFASQAGTQIPLQVFGTDINELLLDKARAGLYSRNDVQEVAPERLRRFFVQEDAGYRICKSVRELCVFAKHDVLSDPSFSRLDLVSCRNLMIYLQPVLHERLVAIFHYSLEPGGFLVLGGSETIGGSTQLFSTFNKTHKLYCKIPALNRPLATLQPKAGPPEKITAGQRPGPLTSGLAGEGDVQKEADRLLLAKYAPAGVLINEAMEILQFRGRTSIYLEPPPGRASYNLLKMVREGLLVPVRAAIQKAKTGHETAVVENVEFRYENRTRRTSIQVVPLKNLKGHWYLVLFEPAPPGGAVREPAARPRAERPLRPNVDKALGENARLRNELAATRDYLQLVTEQHDAASEELQAANEEAQSSNEELQSINEELETTKEELQSTNEELTTINEEMTNRNLELHRTNSDLHNVLGAVRMCIVVLDGGLCIRRFTPLAEKMLNLVPTDVGRPITNIRFNFDFPDLEAVILEVINTARPQEKEVQSKDGLWHSLRILPYKTLDNRIDGAVLVLVNIDALKRSEQRIHGALDYAESIIETVREPLLVLKENLQIERANRSFYRIFQASPGETQGQLLSQIGGGQWDDARLRALLEEVLSRNTAFDDFEVEREFERIGHRIMLLNGRPIPGGPEHARRILLAIEDITERKQLEKQVEERTTRFRETVQELEAFSYSISHDLRSPLRAMSGFAELALDLGREQLTPQVKDYLQRVIAGAHRADRLVQDVLTYSRVSRANIRLAPIDLEKLLREVIEEYPKFQPPNAEIRVLSPLLKMMGHEASLGQCVTNLLGNAIKFVAPGTVPQIKIWTEPVQGQARIWFEDNGIGIEPANQARIFGIFERVHSAREFEGTGIGLAIVRKGVERMEGSVGVESELGKGSRFWIQLKAAETYEQTDASGGG